MTPPYPSHHRRSERASASRSASASGTSIRKRRLLFVVKGKGQKARPFPHPIALVFSAEYTESQSRGKASRKRPLDSLSQHPAASSFANSCKYDFWDLQCIHVKSSNPILLLASQKVSGSPRVIICSNNAKRVPNGRRIRYSSSISSLYPLIVRLCNCP